MSPLDSCLTFLLTRFLIESHLLHFYLLANVIIACGYEGQPQKWGDLNPESGRLWRLIVEDCDFYTFIPKLRPLLAPDVFMKDYKWHFQVGDANLTGKILQHPVESPEDMRTRHKTVTG